MTFRTILDWMEITESRLIDPNGTRFASFERNSALDQKLDTTQNWKFSTGRLQMLQESCRYFENK